MGHGPPSLVEAGTITFMEFVKAQKFTARVSEKYFLNDLESYLLVKLELVAPDRIQFAAGQYVSIKVNDSGERRSYSIASTPDVDHGITLVAEMIPNGKGSEYLKHLNPGDTVEILGPLGRFAADVAETPRKLLFVATGSGVAPIHSMITDLLVNKRETRPIRFNWGMRNEQSLFWFDNYERFADEHPNFVYDIVLSQPNEDWSLCRGHVQDCIKRDFEKANLAEWDVYVCGNPRMVEENSVLFQQMGLPSDQFHHEKFT